MVNTGIKPDFITIDGGEGGTGAAPVEFSNSLGMPLRDGLSFAYDTLNGFDLKKDIKLIASGKIISGFHMARAMALGADLCNSARGMMLSLGCIQALQCNKNTCPVGVATQNKSLMKGLNVENKATRVANYHHETLHSLIELLAASGIKKPEDITREHINRRVNSQTVMNYAEIFPEIKRGSLIK
jgi:glutamate synthase domain-containing protein 2